MTAQEHFDQGRRAFEAKQLAESAEAFRRAVLLEPTNAAFHRSLAAALLADGKVTEAEMSVRHAIESDPVDPESHFLMGHTVAQAGRHWDAIRHLDQALDIMPNHIGARRQLVKSLVEAGRAASGPDPEYASLVLDRALKLEKGNPEIAAAAIHHYLDHSDLHRAVRIVRDLPEASRQHPAMVAAMGRIARDPQGASMIQVLGPAPAMPKSAVNVQTTIDCPQCRQPIPDWVAVCPHCQVRVKAGSMAALADLTPQTDWRETAYKVMCWVYIVPAAIGIVVSLLTGGGAEDIVIYGLSIAISVALLLEVEIVQFVAKYYFMAAVLMNGLMLVLAIAQSDWIVVALSTFLVGVSGFMLYLLNLMVD